MHGINGGALTSGDLYTAADRNANIFNLKCLSVLSLFVAVSVVLNEFGLFLVDCGVMFAVAGASLTLFLLPVAIFLVHDRLLKKSPSVTESEGLKLLIIACAYVGVALTSVALTMHVVLLAAVPVLIAAQYRSKKHTFACCWC